eukprot:GHVQ01009004.1.p4 GENE.GHVQ01009004.1~~GHVQ01009004.1.p4  ORF type:complete len:280 (+),score=71.19 GHVQ01009004.1:160-999(+)
MYKAGIGKMAAIPLKEAIKQRIDQAEDAERRKELILDCCTLSPPTSDDADCLKQYTSLTTLSCNQCGLKSLDGFPLMSTLKTFELTDNYMNGGLERLVEVCPNVRTLILGGNKIKTLEHISPLKQLKELQFLDLDVTPLSELPDYRSKVFELLPQLKALDNSDKNGTRVEENEEEESEYEDEDDEDEPEQGEEDGDTTLKDFYAKDYVEADDDGEEAEEFAPQNEEEEDEEIDEEDEDIDDEDGPEDSATAGKEGKRALEKATNEQDSGGVEKKTRTDG